MSTEDVPTAPTAVSDAPPPLDDEESDAPLAPNIYSPDAILLQLQAVPEPRDASCTALLGGLTSQVLVLKYLQQQKTNETIEEQDVCLLTFLKGAYLQLSALPGTVRYDMLATAVASSGLVAPFIAGVAAQGDSIVLNIGAPTNTDVLCDTLSEVVRAATAAVCCYVHYLTFPQAPNSFPTDDGALIFTTLSIRSLAEEEIAASVDASAAAIGFDPIAEGFGVKHLRWLMHHVRGELLGYFAQVQHLLGNETKMRDSYLAQKHERLCCVKAVQEQAAGHAAYTTSCLQMQQHAGALLFANRGLQMAADSGAGFYAAQLQLQRGAALALGGGGARFNVRSVAATQLAAEGHIEKLLAWLPVPYHDLLTFGPEEEIVCGTVLEAEGLMVLEEGEEEGEAGPSSASAAAAPASAPHQHSGSSSAGLTMSPETAATTSTDGATSALQGLSILGEGVPAAEAASGGAGASGQADGVPSGGSGAGGALLSEALAGLVGPPAAGAAVSAAELPDVEEDMRPALVALFTVRPLQSVPPGAIVPVEDEAAADAVTQAAPGVAGAGVAGGRGGKGKAAPGRGRKGR